MLIAIIGENCSGKSTLATEIQKVIGAETVTGKDYLRLAKSESEAEKAFIAKLANAVSGDNMIYVISEKQHIALLPDGAIRILVKADIETIKDRFKKRLRGNLPPPVEQMLIRNHGVFDAEKHDIEYDGVSGDPAEVRAYIENIGGNSQNNGQAQIR